MVFLILFSKRALFGELFFYLIFLKKERRVMDLTTIYNTIQHYAINTQNVESYTIGDPYTVWNSLHMTYGAFSANLNYVRRVDGYNILNMTFYYGGKLDNDSANVYVEQTNGFKAILNVIRHLKENYELDDYGEIQITPFWQQFSDLLAGAYADVNIYIPVDDTCEDYDKE